MKYLIAILLVAMLAPPEAFSQTSKEKTVKGVSLNPDGQCLLIKSPPHRPGYSGFKKQLFDWEAQLKVAENKKWLDKNEIRKFADWHSELTVKEAALAEKGYARPFADELDKEFTRFNAEFCKSMSKTTRSRDRAPARTSRNK